MSLIVATFEVMLEKSNGWASGLSQHFWGKKLWKGSILSRICEKPYITVYHLTMFGGVVPAILAGEYLFLRLFDAAHPLDARVFGGLTLVRGHYIAMVPALFFPSMWLAICAFEDFLWFVMNWHYPGSLRDFFTGNVWWQTHWLKLFGICIPRFYFLVIPIATLGLAASTYPFR